MLGGDQEKDGSVRVTSEAALLAQFSSTGSKFWSSGTSQPGDERRVASLWVPSPKPDWAGW